MSIELWRIRRIDSLRECELSGSDCVAVILFSVYASVFILLMQDPSCYTGIHT